MPRYHLLSALVLCAVIIGGMGILAENYHDTDETLYAEVPVAQTPPAPDVASSTAKYVLPVLVYHIVRPSYPGDSPAVHALAHTPETFDAEMKYLGDAGYHVVSFGDLENHFRGGAPLPAHPIIISFDDGWSDQFIYAFPILQKYHYTATFFVFTNAIGRPQFLSWNELGALRDAGMTIGSHSRTHPYLTHITDPAVLESEIVGSKQILERKLGVPIHEFAYPFGQYNASILAAVEQAGYLSARGDHYYRGEQSLSRLYELDALNAPTTTALFAQKFPAF